MVGRYNEGEQVGCVFTLAELTWLLECERWMSALEVASKMDVCGHKRKANECSIKVTETKYVQSNYQEAGEICLYNSIMFVKIKKFQF